MSKTLIFYSDIEWEEDFYKGNIWNFSSHFPKLYVNKEHIKLLNKKFFKDCKKKKEQPYKYFKKIKITITES